MDSQSAGEKELNALRRQLEDLEIEVSEILYEVTDLRSWVPEMLDQMYADSKENRLEGIEISDEEEEEETIEKDQLTEYIEYTDDVIDLEDVKKELHRQLEKAEKLADENQRFYNFLETSLEGDCPFVLPKARYLSRLTNISFL